MSKELELIAEHRVECTFWPAHHDDEVRNDCARDLYAVWVDCGCGESMPLSEHPAHVVSRLSEHGYSIVQVAGIEFGLEHDGDDLVRGPLQERVARAVVGKRTDRRLLTRVFSPWAAAAAEEDQ